MKPCLAFAFLSVLALCSVASAQTAVTIAGGVTISGGVSFSGPSAPVPASFFGIQVNLSASTWPDSVGVHFGGWRSLASSVDKWSDINTSAGVYNWASSFDVWLAKAIAGGEDVLYTLYYTPAWASSNPSGSCTALGNGGCYPPADLNSDGTGTDQTFKDFVTALMNHVGAGKIKYLEVWNEPNITTEWNGTTAQLVRMSQDARSVAQAIDPSVLIVSPAETGDGGGLFVQMAWLDGFLAAGGGAYVDAIGFHGYTNSGNPEDLATRIANARTVMANHGQQAKPLFDTEASWGSSGTLTDPDLQAAFTGRTYMIQISQGVNRFYWFEWDRTTSNFWVSGSTLTTAGTAYQQIRQWTLGATPQGHCVAAGATWTCGLARGSSVSLVVWDTSQTCSGGSCGTISFTIPAGLYSSYNSLDGSSTAINPAATTVPVGVKPILLVR